MRHRFRDTPEAQGTLAFANRRPATPFPAGLGASLNWDIDAYKDLHTDVVGLMDCLVHLSASRERMPDPTSSLIDYRNAVAMESRHITAAIDLHEEIRQKGMFVGFSDGGLVSGLLELVLGVRKGAFEILRCKIPECRAYFVEDRNIRDPAKKQKFCNRKCRERWHNKKYGSEYFKQKKRESRARV